MCERELETEQNCNILTSTLLAITAFLSRSPGLLNRGPGAQPLWVLVFSTASYHQLIWSPTDWIFCALSYIIVQRPPSSCGRHNFALIQPVHGQGNNPDIPRPDAPVSYTGAFPILTAWLGRRSIYNSISHCANTFGKVMCLTIINLVGRVFANAPEDLGSIPGGVIPKTLRMVLETSLFNTQWYKVRIKGKVEQSRERSSALPYTSVQ